MARHKDKIPYKYLNLRVPAHSPLGKMISYVHDHPNDAQTLVLCTLQARFLPFAMDKTAPQFKEIAIQSAEACESWARAIRIHADLPHSVMNGAGLQLIQTSNTIPSISSSSVEDISEEIDRESSLEIDEDKNDSIDTAMGAIGLNFF
ncbi:MAG: hypothetical protein ACFBSE_25045 [Prochloraceae cyanobacterium]